MSPTAESFVWDVVVRRRQSRKGTGEHKPEAKLGKCRPLHAHGPPWPVFHHRFCIQRDIDIMIGPLLYA